MKNLLETKNYEAIRQALTENPSLANEGIPFDDANQALAHPLHRVCDGVFSGKYSDEEALEMAKIFVEFGADINGGKLVAKKDTPLIAASSLGADLVACYYVDQDAEIGHGGTHGGTALHWAAWCGRPLVVEKLIKAGAEINRICIDHQASPLFWAIHGFKFVDGKDPKPYAACARILIEAGADKTIPNGDG
ncbi:MAG: ankyrin repeat domain-containing protein, partial [Acidobacteria bacterium]|nr:ankyrin repeat domain-containing protein [Acidobacteriota bacterium]